MVKTAVELRSRLEEPAHIAKLEQFLATWKSDKKKCPLYIQEVSGILP